MKFIFKITTKEGDSEQDYIDSWGKGSSIIQGSNGAQGTILYRKINEPGVFFAIATWESKEARDIAMKKLDLLVPEFQVILNKHKECGNIEVLGNFEEVARVNSKDYDSR